MAGWRSSRRATTIYGSTTTNRGKSFLYIVNIKTGALIEKIATDEGGVDDPHGFAYPVAFIPDYTNYLTDYIYGGDLKGNIRRFDLRGTASTFSSVKIASLTTGGTSPTPQPVTTEPRVELAKNGINRWIFVGTGRLLSVNDMSDTQQQTMYAIRDGSKSQVFGTATGQQSLPEGLSFPISRTNLVANTNLTTGITTDSTKPMGWYYDLTGSNERVSTQLLVNAGVVVWAGTMPANDVCSPGADSRLYGVSFSTGKTRFIDSNGLPMSYASSTTAVIKYSIVSVHGQNKVIGWDINDNPTTPLNLPADLTDPKRIQWREIQK